MADTALQRKNMVESQVRPSDVTDRRIMAAMSQVPRERFVPAELSSLAYMDQDLPLRGGRALLAPRTLARLLQLCSIEDTDKVLDVGALTGYAAVILGKLAGSVVALESDEAFSSQADKTFKDMGTSNVAAVCGPLPAGYVKGSPYNIILIEGAVEIVPDALLSQLAPGGRLVAIEASGSPGRGVVISRGAGGAISKRIVFDADGPAIQGFAKPKTFTF